MEDYVTALIDRYENNKISHPTAPAGFYRRSLGKLALSGSIIP
jgi:hypothetical protein